MTEDAQLKLRVPAELKDFLESQAKINQRTINGEVVYRLDKTKQQEIDPQADSGRSIYFNDLNCVENLKEISLRKQQEDVTAMISDLFFRHPQYQLINIETLNDGKKIRYWYSIPRGESFRN